MVNRLSILYELQIIDNQLDELEELRGDLPKAVNELKEDIKEREELIEEKEKQKKEATEKIKTNEDESERLQENLKKFKAQLFQVRNNKEYDALTKEIDHTEETIKSLADENIALDELIIKANIDIEDIKPELEKFSKELELKEEELTKIIKTNEREEVKLQERREKIAAQVKKPDYNTYMRIRKAKGGRAIASIQRAACNGCHNIVPPQRQLEIKQNKRVYTCEACGRMLVSADIADDVNSKY